MLGWHISVYRLTDETLRDIGEGSAAVGTAITIGSSVKERLIARDPSGLRERLAVWQASLGGLDWIEEIVEQGQGVALLGGGYPSRYLIRAADAVPSILGGPPCANETWIFGAHDIIGPGWLGKTTVDEEALTSSEPDEWLLVEVWDES